MLLYKSNRDRSLIFCDFFSSLPPGASGRVSGVMWAPSISNKLRSIVGAPVSWLPLTRELPKGEGEKSLRFARIYDESYRFSDFFLSFRRPHLPHQREARTWKPPPTKIIIHIADSSRCFPAPFLHRKIRFVEQSSDPAVGTSLPGRPAA